MKAWTPVNDTTAHAALSPAALHRENHVFRGTGGRSPENRARGFIPAFLDTETGVVYPACFADGRRAPMHLLDGLPDEVVVTRLASGTVTEVKGSVIAGFMGRCRFFTRAQAARATRLMSRFSDRTGGPRSGRPAATCH